MDASDFPAAVLYIAAVTLGSASVVAVCTLVLCRSSLFKPIRDWLADPSRGQFWWFFSKLIKCTFCTSIWLSILAWQLNRVLHGSSFWWTFNPFTIAATAAPIIWLVFNAHKYGGES